MQGGCGTSRYLRGVWGLLGRLAGHVEEALVLLVHLYHQVEQLCLTFVCRLCQLCFTLMHPLCQQLFSHAGRGKFLLEDVDETL